jgi:hypothetical protein
MPTQKEQEELTNMVLISVGTQIPPTFKELVGEVDGNTGGLIVSLTALERKGMATRLVIDGETCIRITKKGDEVAARLQLNRRS